MSALETIGQVAGGLQQAGAGMQAGMSLYSQYDDMQAKARESQSKREIEAQIGQMSQNGELNDPIEAPKALAKLYMDHGLSDIAAQYQQHADASLKAAGDKRLMSAASMAKLDPFGAAAQLNEHAKLMQTGEQFIPIRTPKGIQISYKGPGGETVKEYASGEEFHADVLEYAMPYLDPGGLGEVEKTRSEVDKNKAMSENYRASALAEAELLPGKKAELAASAAASGAAAGANRERAITERESRPAVVDELQSRAEKNRELSGGTWGKALKEAGIVNDPNSLTPTPIERDPVALTPLTAALHGEMGTSKEESAALAIRLAGMDKIRIDPDEGYALDVYGTKYPIGVDAARVLDEIRAKREAARKAAAEE